MLLMLLLFFFSVVSAEVQPGGSLVMIGGGLQPDNSAVYTTFIRLGGGKENIRIAIIPAASAGPVKSGTSYIRDFVRYGVAEERIKLFPLAIKDDASTKETDESSWSPNAYDKELAREMLNYSAVFFVGGDQERYMKTLKTADGKDTPLLASVRKVLLRGGVIGGTSAGAAIMSDPMLCGGNPLAALLEGTVFQGDACPGKGGARLTRGLGFFPHGLVDQHFIKRGRFGRLISALFYLKHVRFGAGIDEDTAAVYRSKDRTIEVVGRSGVLLVDSGSAQLAAAGSGTSVKVRNLILHYLEAGDVYHLDSGTFSINKKRKKIEPGKEYYETSPLKSDIFARDAVKEIITAGLTDNRQSEAVGIAFTLGSDPKEKTDANGVRLVFRKSKGTCGYWAKIEGKGTYSALNVYLDIVPVTVQVKPLPE
jgi:cyanophycinase